MTQKSCDRCGYKGKRIVPSNGLNRTLCEVCYSEVTSKDKKKEKTAQEK